MIKPTQVKILSDSTATHVVKPFKGIPSEVPIFSLVGNEAHFLPHFLDHYRRLSVSEFHFLVERSDDGTLEYLLGQPDCAVMTTPFGFGDTVTYRRNESNHVGRFANFIRMVAVKKHLMDRWCLVLDADEFLILPKNTRSLSDLVSGLEAHQLRCCRALMVDFFPETLAILDRQGPEVNPFTAAPFYDALTVDWPAGNAEPRELSYQCAVRARIAEELTRRYSENREKLESWVPSRLYKTPLLRVEPNTFFEHPHKLNAYVTDQAQCVLAHFKFYPGWRQKCQNAIEEGQYVGGSVKYQPLIQACSELNNWSLIHSKSLDNRLDPIEQSPMAFNHLDSPDNTFSPARKHAQLSSGSDVNNARRYRVPYPIIWQEPNRKQLTQLHIANRGARNSTVTGVVWLNDVHLVANHRDGLKIALFDIRKGTTALATADLPNLTDTVTARRLRHDLWEIVTSDCWHGLYTKLYLKVGEPAFFKRQLTQWHNRNTFCHGVSYDAKGRLWLALSTGSDPRIECEGERVWRLPKPWGCREVCFDDLREGVYAIAVSSNPKNSAYEQVSSRIYELNPRTEEWRLIRELHGVHADSGAVYQGRLWINDQYADQVLGINLTNPSHAVVVLKTKDLSFPHGVAVSPRGLLAVTNYGASSISFIDLAALNLEQ